MRSEYIIEKANELVAFCGGRNPFYAAEQTGAILKFKDLGSLKGAYFGKMEKPVIVINEQMGEKMQSLICAHELGHHILHKGQMLSCKVLDCENAAILEREANIFASAFLIDSKKAVELLKSGYTVCETAAQLETRSELLLFSLKALGFEVLTDSEFLKN